jgi:integrase
MSLWKRGRFYWIDVVLNGQRYREPLGVTDVRQARKLEKDRVVEFSSRRPDPSGRRRVFGSLTLGQAVTAYVQERRTQVSPRMLKYWAENGRRLVAVFGDVRIRTLTIDHLTHYQQVRADEGRAPKTINGELSVLRQILRHARLWYRFEEDYRALRNTKPPIGQALTDDEQQRLFAAAHSRPDWIFAYVAATLSFYCGMRACEVKGLQWKHVDLVRARIQIRRSKTPAGWRDPSLNDACLQAIREMRSRAERLGFAAPDHFVFAWQGRRHVVDPTRPMESWRTAWRSLRAAAGLRHVRFHDGRHTALTRLCEAGQPDWVIQAQMGHVSPTMMKTYSHIRRKALDDAAKSLEPTFPLEFPKDKERPRHKGRFAPFTGAIPDSDVTVASQSADLDREFREITKEIGSSGWIRTSNPPVNSRMLYH